MSDMSEEKPPEANPQMMENETERPVIMSLPFNPGMLSPNTVMMTTGSEQMKKIKRNQASPKELISETDTSKI